MNTIETPSPTHKLVSTRLHPGNWVSVTAELNSGNPESILESLRSQGPERLLTRSGLRTSNPFRYGMLAEGSIGIFGELRMSEDDDYDQTKERLAFLLAEFDSAATGSSFEPVGMATSGADAHQALNGEQIEEGEHVEEQLESVLEAMGASWTQQDLQWTVSLDEVPNSDVTVSLCGTLLTVDGLLCQREGGWPPLSRQAMARFLLEASSQVRMARYQFEADRIHAVACCLSGEAHHTLADCIRAVIHARQRLAGELCALADESIACAYLKRCQMQDQMRNRMKDEQ